MIDDVVNGPPILPDFVDDDNILKRVRQTRMAILDDQLKRGIPNDPDGFEMLHKNLVELDKGAFKSKQLKQEEKSSEANARLAKEIAEVMASKMGSALFSSDSAVKEDIPNPTHLTGHIEPAPGELKIGDDTTTYEVFSSTVGRALDEARRANIEE